MTLYAYDLFHAEMFIKTFLIFSYIAPVLLAILIVFGLISSSYQTFNTDREYGRWLVRVLVVMICVSTLFGGVIGVSLFKQAPGENALTGITQILTYKNPGEGARKLTLPAYGFTPSSQVDAFSTDYEIAYAEPENFASAQIFRPTSIDAYLLTPSVLATRPDLEFGPAWVQLNARLESRSIIGRTIFEVMNMLTYQSFAWAKKFDNKTIAEAVGRNGNLNIGEAFSSWKSSDELEVYAANGSGPSGRDEYYVPTVNTYPGGPTDYYSYITARTKSVQNITEARTVSPDKVIARASGDTSAEGPTYSRELYDEAISRGYTSQVPPEIYVQTHLSTHAEQCNNEPFSAESSEAQYAESGLAAILSPCKFILTRRNTGLGGMLDRDFNLGLRDAFNALIGGNEAIAGALGKIAQVQDLGLGNFLINDESCSDVVSLEAADRVYRRWKSEAMSDPRVAANASCVDQGHNAVIALLVTRDFGKRAADMYDSYLGRNRGPWALEDDGAYAMVIGGDDNGPTGGSVLAVSGTSDVPLPIFSSVNELIRPISDGDGLPATVSVKTPTSIANETQANDSILGEVAAGVSTAGGTAAVIVAKTNPGFMSRAWTAVKTGASKATSAVKKVGSKVGGKIAAKVAGGPLSLIWDGIKTGMSIIPIAALLFAYTLIYYKTIFSVVLGLAAQITWAFVQIPKQMHKQDDAIPFPFGTFALGFIIIAIELACLAIASGLFLRFMVGFGESFMEALTGTGLGLATAVSGEFTGRVVGDPLGSFTAALEPLGLMAGIFVIPALFQKTLTDGYKSTMSGMPLSMQMAGVGGILTAARQNMGGGKGGGNTEGPQDAKPTDFDAAADKAEK